MSYVPAYLRRLVLRRANRRCEYCRLAQAGQEAASHVDHVVPASAGGPTSAANLALAYASCSLRKEARRTALDPITERRVLLFHPRRQEWSDHFQWDGFEVVGRTPTGRATVAALRMNRPTILSIRAEEAARGRHPPEIE